MTLLEDWAEALAATWKVTPRPSSEDLTAARVDLAGLELATLHAMLDDAGLPLPV
jgi:hypothetical protein